MSPSRDGDLDALRGLAVSLVVSTHFLWVFLPNLVIGNFSAVEGLTGISPFPFCNLPYPNILAVTCLCAISGWAIVSAQALRPPNSPVIVEILRRYLRLLLPALVAGAGAFALAAAFSDVHFRVSEAVYGFEGWTWLSQFWSEEAGAQKLAAEFFLGRTERESSILPVLWMMKDLFVGSALVIVVLGCSSSRLRLSAMAIIGITLLIALPLAGAVILGAALGLVRHGQWVPPPMWMRWPLLVTALFLGLNPGGSGTGGMTLRTWYSSWLPDSWGLPVTAMAGVLILHAALPFSPRVARRFRHGLRLSSWLGRRSYGIFLLHFPILLTVSCSTYLAVIDIPSRGVALVAAAIVTVLSLALAVMPFHRLVELPVEKLLKRMASL